MSNNLDDSLHYIFEEGRLLDRVIAEHFFVEKNPEKVLKALRAYQNEDGGFGNGIELDLLCPESSPIGLETALYTLWLLDYKDEPMLESMFQWVKNNLDENFELVHPIEAIKKYPHGEWWENPDPSRIYSIVSYFKYFGYEDEVLTDNLKEQLNVKPDEVLTGFYSYPYYMFMDVFQCSEMLDISLEEKVLSLVKENKKYYPLISRYWSWFIPLIGAQDIKFVKNEVQYFKDNIDEHGGIKSAYPELPKWTPVFTLDGLCILKRFKI